MEEEHKIKTEESTIEPKKGGLLGHIFWIFLILGMGSCNGLLNQVAEGTMDSSAGDAGMNLAFMVGGLLGAMVFPFMIGSIFTIAKKFRNTRSYLKVCAIIALISLVATASKLGNKVNKQNGFYWNMPTTQLLADRSTEW